MLAKYRHSQPEAFRRPRSLNTVKMLMLQVSSNPKQPLWAVRAPCSKNIRSFKPGNQNSLLLFTKGSLPEAQNAVGYPNAR